MPLYQYQEGLLLECYLSILMGLLVHPVLSLAFCNVAPTIIANGLQVGKHTPTVVGGMPFGNDMFLKLTSN